MICQVPLSLFQNNPHRTMIGPHNIGMNRGLGDTVSEFTRSQEIINSPTRIIRSRISKIGPPSVGSFEARISLTEDVDESDIHKRIESSSLFESISVFSFILFRVFEVYRLVCDIEISTKYHWFVYLEFVEKYTHSSIPFLSIFEAREVVLGIGNIGIHKIEILEFESKCASFIISFCPDTIHDSKWCDFREHGSTRIAWSLRRIKYTLISE